MPKKIILLGSTGSIGQKALEVIEDFPDEFELTGISAHSNIKLLQRHCEKFKPKSVCISNPVYAEMLKENNINGSRLHAGSEGLREMVRNTEADLVINSIVGAAGLLPTLDAIETGKDIALSNKESLVVAGELVMSEVEKYGVQIFPIDSEHSAIWQCLRGEKKKEIKRIILTVSGGPFLKREADTFYSITVEEALNHPNWKMGNKITIDSSTLMNKGLEVIETHWLFGIQPENIDVVTHEQSIVHSMVEFIDGSIKSQMGIPDMKIPVQFAMTYPDRFPGKIDNNSFFSRMKLTFEPPDEEKFPCLNIAYRALEAGGTAPAAMNAANEVAVELFLNRKIKFTEIPELIDRTLQDHKITHKPTIQDYMDADKWARSVTQEKVMA